MSSFLSQKAVNAILIPLRSIPEHRSLLLFSCFFNGVEHARRPLITEEITADSQRANESAKEGQE